MCTLTFIPKSSNSFVLTSNRDEDPQRNTIVPAKYLQDGVTLLFPKDEKAGGTWIGVSTRKRLICLLNGGYIAHERAKTYRMSRGVVVRELLGAFTFKKVIDTFDFNGIEPFTIIVIDWEKKPTLFELVWDGVKIYFEEKPWASHIWSSSLLYSQKTKQLREKWFAQFLFKSSNPEVAEILNFHKLAGKENIDNALIMDRGFVKTKSITQIFKVDETIEMHYQDLQTKEITSNIL